MMDTDKGLIILLTIFPYIVGILVFLLIMLGVSTCIKQNEERASCTEACENHRKLFIDNQCWCQRTPNMYVLLGTEVYDED